MYQHYTPLYVHLSGEGKKKGTGFLVLIPICLTEKDMSIQKVRK